MASPVNWDEIESRPWFSELTPEGKVGVLNDWQKDFIGGLDDPTERVQVAAMAKSKAERLLGKPAPENPFRSLIDDKFSRTKAATTDYDLFTSGELPDDLELQGLDEAIKGRRDSAIARGSLFINPNLVWDKPSYEKAVKESGADPVEQAMTLLEYDNRKEGASQQLAEALSYTDKEFRSFYDENKGKGVTKVVEEWKEKQKLPEGIFGSIQGIGRQLALGISAGGSGLERALGGIGAAMGIPGAQEYAQESGAEAASKSAARSIGGGPELLGDVAEGAVSIVPTVGVGLAGAALTASGVGAGVGIPLTGLAAGAITGGLQSFGASQADAYEFYSSKGDPDAYERSLKDAAVSGAITTAVTALSGKVGDKLLGGARGIEGLFRKSGKEVLSTAGASTIKQALNTGFGKLASNTTEEALEEATDQLLQGMYERAVRDPNKDFQTIMEETIEAGKIGGILGGGMQGGKMALSRLLNGPAVPENSLSELELQEQIAQRKLATEAAEEVVGAPAVDTAVGKAVEVAQEIAPLAPSTAEALAQVAGQAADETRQRVDGALIAQDALRQQLESAEEEGVMLDVFSEERAKAQSRQEAADSQARAAGLSQAPITRPDQSSTPAIPQTQTTLSDIADPFQSSVEEIQTRPSGDIAVNTPVEQEQSQPPPQDELNQEAPVQQEQGRGQKLPKPRKLPVVPAQQEAQAPQADAGPSDGVGSVYQRERNGVMEWMVQSGEERGFGDFIFDSQEEAERAGNIERSNYESRKKTLAELEKSKQQEAERKTSSEAAPRAFTEAKGMRGVSAERATSVLTQPASRRSQSAGKIYSGTKADVTSQMVADGYVPSSEGKGFTLVKGDGESIFKVTKIEHDYALWLIEQNPISPAKTGAVPTESLPATGQLTPGGVGAGAAKSKAQQSPDELLADFSYDIALARAESKDATGKSLRALKKEGRAAYEKRTRETLRQNHIDAINIASGLDEDSNAEFAKYGMSVPRNPVSSAAVEAYNITLPAGYTLNETGDLYIYAPDATPAPQSQPPAATTATQEAQQEAEAPATQPATKEAQLSGDDSEELLRKLGDGWKINGTVISNDGFGHWSASKRDAVVRSFNDAGIRTNTYSADGKGNRKSSFTIYSSDAQIIEEALLDRSKKASAIEGSKKDKEQKEREEKALQSVDSVALRWMNGLFGDDFANPFNKSKLSDFVTGKSVKFEGMVNPKWINGVQSLDAVIEGGRVDFQKLRENFQSFQANEKNEQLAGKKSSQPDLQPPSVLGEEVQSEGDIKDVETGKEKKETVSFVHTTTTEPGKGQRSGYYPGTYAYESETGLLPPSEGKRFIGELPERDIYTLNRSSDKLKKDAADSGFGFHSGNGNSEVEYLKSLGYKAMRRASSGGMEIIVFDHNDANFVTADEKSLETATSEEDSLRTVAQPAAVGADVVAPISDSTPTEDPSNAVVTDVGAVESPPITIESKPSSVKNTIKNAPKRAREISKQEAADVAQENAASERLRDAVNELPDAAKAKWTPAILAQADQFYITGDESKLKDLTPIQVKKVKEHAFTDEEKAAFDKELEKRHRVLNQDTRTQEEKDRLAAELEELRNQDEARESLPPGFSQKLTPQHSNLIKPALRLIERIFPNISGAVIIDTQENLLKRKDLTKEERDDIASIAQGIYSRGKVYVILDNVVVTDKHRDGAHAIAATAFHEIMHAGSDVFRRSSKLRSLQVEWQDMVDKNVTKDDINELINMGYTRFSDWENNPETKRMAQEEAFVRKLEEMFIAEGPAAFKKQGLMQRFKRWLNALLDRILGRPAKPRTDEELYKWGRFWVLAVQNGHYLLADDSSAPVDSAQSLPKPLPFDGDTESSRILSTYLSDEQTAEVDKFFQERGVNDSLTNFAQVLGKKGIGEQYTVQSIAPLQQAALDFIGFTEDEDGQVVTNRAATVKAKETAAKMLRDPNFVIGYQTSLSSSTNSADAAGAILQLELVRYGLALAAKGDFSLIGLVKRDWNGIILGKYLTAASAGRVLQARGSYASDVSTTISALKQEQIKAALEWLKKNGSGAEMLEDLKQAAQIAQFDFSFGDSLEKSQKGRDINNAKTDPMGWFEKAYDSLAGAVQSKVGALMSQLARLADIKSAKELRAKNAAAQSGDAKKSLPDFRNYEPIGEDLDAEEAKTLAEIERLVDEINADMIGDTKVPKAKDPQTPAKPRKKRTPKPDTTASEGGDSDVDDNEDTKAAREILADLVASLAEKASAKKFTDDVKKQIRRVVRKYIQNTDKLNYQAFVDGLSAELLPPGFEIEDTVLEELVEKTWETHVAAPQKAAEQHLARLKSTFGPELGGPPQSAKDVTALVKEMMVNKKQLDAPAMLKEYRSRLDKLGVKGQVVTDLITAAHGESVRRRAERFNRRFDDIRKGLLAGARKSFIATVAKEKDADITNPDWQEQVFQELFAKAGFNSTEAATAATMLMKDAPAIFAQAGVQIAQNTQQKAEETVKRLIRRYGELRAPVTNPTQEAEKTRKMNIAALFRQQVKVPVGKDEFTTQAKAFGATEAQGNLLFEQAAVERNIKEASSGTPTRLQGLVKYIKSRPALELNDPLLREQMVREFLEANGFAPQQVEESLPWVLENFEKYINMAREKQIESVLRKNANFKKAMEAKDAALSTQAERELKRQLEAIRAGIANKGLTGAEALAEQMGVQAFTNGDFRSLAELDLKITRAQSQGRAHDMAAGIEELFSLLARRKGPKGFLDILAIAFNNSALSTVSATSVNYISPAGSIALRIGMDLSKATARRDWDMAEAIFSSAREAFSLMGKEASYAFKGDVYVGVMQRQILKVTNLENEFRAGLKALRDKKSSPLQKLNGLVKVLYASTDLTRRILSTADQMWMTTMQGYFLKTQASKLLMRAGLKPEIVQGIVMKVSMDTANRIQAEKTLINEYRQLVQDMRGKTDAEIERAYGIMVDEPPASLPAGAKEFDIELRGGLRRDGVGRNGENKIKALLKHLSLQDQAVDLRQRDLMQAEIIESVKVNVSEKMSKELASYVVKESELETGNHRGEEGDWLDIFNTATQLVLTAGRAVKARNPILGTMMLGYFGVPINLLNRAMWYTPYGLYRYAVAKKAGAGMAESTFYKQSMDTSIAMKDRLSEAIAGTTATALLVALKGLSDDDDEPLFNVTLAGPSNRTEYDAWIKQGHRKGAIEMNVGDKVVSLNWARGPLEPLKVAMILVGAFDDMKLNRKIGKDQPDLSISDYMASALSGWSQQTAFFGAKNTIGAVFSATPDASTLGDIVYKVAPIIPWSGFINSVGKLATGPNVFRGREGAIYANLPIANIFGTNRAINALGDPVGVTEPGFIAQGGDRAWYAGLPIYVGGAINNSDKAVYEFILDRGTGPGLPQRTAIEAKNGLKSDPQWLDYVAYRGRIAKMRMKQELPRLKGLDDDSLTKAIADISTDATKEAKRRFQWK